MEDELIHELCAAYALDALAPEDERRFEAHLAGCPLCQEELANLAPTVTSLAHAAPPAQPSEALRARILDAARAERPKVTPLRPRRTRGVVLLAAAAAAATCAAIGLGAWAAVLHNRLGSAKRAVQAVPLKGAAGSVVLTHDGNATMIVSGLVPPPPGKTYEAWVIQGGKAAPAGLFAPGAGTTIVRLTRQVPHGASIAVTLERAGGTDQPTSKPLVTTPSV
jgi:anti-sigma-K factor RskA